VKCRQLVESTQRGRRGHDQGRRVVVPVEIGGKDAVRNFGEKELTGGLVHQLPTVGKDGGAAALADNGLSETSEDDRFASTRWQAIAHRPGAADVGGNQLLYVSDLVRAQLDRHDG
jgi:hypothetical protein